MALLQLFSAQLWKKFNLGLLLVFIIYLLHVIFPKSLFAIGQSVLITKTNVISSSFTGMAIRDYLLVNAIMSFFLVWVILFRKRAEIIDVH
jgi:hypothetical protein